MLSLAICDDDTAFLHSIAGVIQKEFDSSVALSLYRSGVELWHDFSNSIFAPDLLLMDIRMPVLDGIDTCVKIRKLDELLPIVFITNHAEEVSRCFEAHPYYFLTKPLSKDRLVSVLSSAISYAGRLRPQYSLLIKTKQHSYYLPLCDILYIESMGRKVLVHTFSEVHEMYGKISDMREKLSDNGFVYSHRSVLVNLYAVKHIDFINRMITVKNGEQIVLSSDRVSQVKLAQHQMQRLKIND